MQSQQILNIDERLLFEIQSGGEQSKQPTLTEIDVEEVIEPELNNLPVSKLIDLKY